MEIWVKGLRRQGPYLYSEMIRPDGSFQTALTFYYASRLFNSPQAEQVSRNIFGYLRKSDMQVLDPSSPAYGLWTWSSTVEKTYWSDDNPWNTIISLKIYLLTGDRDRLAPEYAHEACFGTSTFLVIRQAVCRADRTGVECVLWGWRLPMV